MRNEQVRVAIQRNPISGAGSRDRELKQMMLSLQQSGLKPYLFTDRERLAGHLQDPEFRQKLLCIVAAGGDGTVDDLINRYPGIPLAIFAMGTENLLAKHCHMPRSGRAVAAVIAARYIRQIDLGQANLGTAGTHRFAVMASCGFDAEVVQRAHAARTGRITKLHYVRPIWQVLRHCSGNSLQLLVDDDQTPRTGELAIISNLSRYALKLPVSPAANDQDGLLDVCLLPKASPWNLISLFLQGKFLGKIETAGIQRFPCRRLQVTSAAPVAIQADGDPLGSTPVEFRVLPAELPLLVPQQFSTGQLPLS